MGIDRHEATLSHCQGCDQYEAGVETFRVTFRDFPGEPGWSEVCRYCPECAGLARSDWTGEMESCVPVAHCDGCDQDEAGVERYDVRHQSGEVETGDYCPDCADWVEHGRAPGIAAIACAEG
jgi:hypothetical protein